MIPETDVLRNKAGDAFNKMDELIRAPGWGDGIFLSGEIGLILYYFTLYEAWGRESDREKGAALLEETFSKVRHLPVNAFGASLAKGLTGFLYIISYLNKKQLAGTERKKEIKAMNRYLFDEAQYLIQYDSNEYLHGSFGIVFYFISLLPDKSAQRYIYTLLDQIQRRAVQDESFFWIRNSLLSNTDEINFGLSHGQSAFLLVLLEALENGIDVDRNYMAVTKGINQILHARQEIDILAEKLSFFPEALNFHTKEVRYTNRLAWNYGDLNEVLLLYRAAETFDNKEYLKIADIVGATSLLRTTRETTLCTNSQFYRGASGLAQFYRVLHGLRPLTAYHNGYLTWIDKTLHFLEVDLDNGLYARKKAALPDGPVVVALTLLSFLHHKEMNWSRCLLM
jgi:lantibiotic biosynthesis protein